MKPFWRQEIIQDLNYALGGALTDVFKYFARYTPY